jgi:vitamin B12/bleomycin/antimicrobial peptide transport system ATP-binding/permease protein
MNTSKGPIPYLDQLTLNRLITGIRRFAASDVGWRAKILFSALLLLMLVLNALNVLNSYIGRDFMTAIELRNMNGFMGWAAVYIGIFVLLTAVAVLFRFAEERLGLLWRDWLTQQFLRRYLTHRAYYQLTSNDEVANPDQRIADDIKAFTTGTLSFFLMFMNASFTVIAFSGVLWSISPLLFLAAVLYAGGGSWLAIKLGRPLIGLNYDQLDREAQFRSGLTHVRKNAEPIALLHRETLSQNTLLARLQRVVDNMERIIELNRNLGFFTTGYNYLIPVIPVLVVAPLFINGSADFGIIAQAAMSFTLLVGAFSLIVTNFQSLSTFTAVVTRLSALDLAIKYSTHEAPHPAADDAGAGNEIIICEDDGVLNYQQLTLLSGQDERVLLKELSLSIAHGTRTNIRCEEELTQYALFRATAGIWEHGAGHIVRPETNEIFFLPGHPYMPHGTLRELLERSGLEQRLEDSRIMDVLQKLNIKDIVQRIGGLDESCKWDCIISPGEQQRLAVARLILASPSFAFIENPASDMTAEEVSNMLRLLTEYDITYIVIGQAIRRRRDDLQDKEYFDAELKIDAQGGWTWSN